MKLVDAIAECERWLAYLEAQKQKSFEASELYKFHSSSHIDGQERARRHDEALRRKRELDNSSVKVYDEAELAKAVAALIVAVRKI